MIKIKLKLMNFHNGFCCFEQSIKAWIQYLDGNLESSPESIYPLKGYGTFWYILTSNGDW